jgi:cytochrome c oxidase subunit 2
MDVIPGRVNKLQVTPTVEGTYAGKCYELCGVYHSRMLFQVEVVSQAKYDAYLEELDAAGQTSDKPLTGGANVETQTGLAEDDNQEGSEE